jgi:hypothetical protein
MEELNDGEESPRPVDSAILEDIAKEKQVQQEDLLQQNIVQVVHEEDHIELEEDIESEEDKKDAHRYKKYKVDPNA